MMKFFFVAIIFAFADGVLIDDCVNIRGTDYEKQILKSNVASPYQLAIDHNTNTLFYSYTARSTEDMFQSAYLDLKTGIFGTVYGINGGFANAVNNNNNIVYMGGEDGLYKFDYNTMTATSLHIMDKLNIWQMFYKDGLYFTTFPEERAYFFKNYQVVKVHALENVNVMLIAADTDNNLVYFNSSGVFLYERANGNTILISDVVANGVSSDRYGNIIFSSPNAIYYVSVAMKEVQHEAIIDNIYGIAVENDGNIIYSTENRIIRLRPATGRCKKLKSKIPESTSPRVIEINLA